MNALHRMSRCFVVSVGTTLLSAAILVTLAVGAGVPAGLANVVAVLCGIGPSFYANRHWVWRRTGRSNLAREVTPFWVLSLFGLAASTVAVGAMSSLAAHWTASERAIALPFANLSTFAVLWLAQFALLDRLLFRPATVIPARPRT